MRKKNLVLCIAVAVIAMVVVPVAALDTQPDPIPNERPNENIWNIVDYPLQQLGSVVNEISTLPRSLTSGSLFGIGSTPSSSSLTTPTIPLPTTVSPLTPGGTSGKG